MPLPKKNKIDMGNPRPSVKTEKHYVTNLVTPETKKAESKAKKRAARQAELNRRARSQRSMRDTQNRKEKQNARVIGSSIRSRSEKDFNVSGNFFGSISSSVKRRIVIAIIAIVVLALGICIGVFVYNAVTSARLSISDQAKAKLVRTQETQPYYMLFLADYDGDEASDPDMLFLTRIDPFNKNFIMIQIPIDTYVASSSGGGTTLKKIYEDSGDAGIIESVATFSEIGISHYVRTNAEGISKLVDAFGGIDVNLKEYVDDPNAGDVYIPQGDVTLNGQEALVLLKATNFSSGTDTISQNQREVCAALLKAALYKKANVAFLIDQLAGLFQTDMGPSTIIDFCDYYKKMDESNIQSTQIPGYKAIRNNVMVFMIDAGEWKNLRTQITYGHLPASEDDYTIADIDPKSFTIIVQNGAGIGGAAGTLTKQLTDMGFQVLESGNAESNEYNDTLIIYNGPAFKKDATVIRNSINNGRLVNGAGLYNMKSDILIIIGNDHKI